jgi:hypothetical protein
MGEGDTVAVKAKSNPMSTGTSTFYETRRRIYGALLLFVVVAGLPIATIPKLRDRFLTRARVLKDAIAGKRAPVVVQVGENHAPFPAEYARPAPPIAQIPQLPHPGKSLSMSQGTSVLRHSDKRPFVKPGDIIVLSPPSAQGAGLAEQTATEAAANNEPKYQQGKTEQQVYDLLLKSNRAIAEIVKGDNPSFKFKSWDVAGRGEDTYWVRLKLQPEGAPEAEYIWLVKLESKQVSPLNYNARAIS